MAPSGGNRLPLAAISHDLRELAVPLAYDRRFRSESVGCVICRGGEGSGERAALRPLGGAWRRLWGIWPLVRGLAEGLLQLGFRLREIREDLVALFANDRVPEFRAQFLDVLFDKHRHLLESVKDDARNGGGWKGSRPAKRPAKLGSGGTNFIVVPGTGAAAKLEGPLSLEAFQAPPYPWPTEQTKTVWHRNHQGAPSGLDGRSDRSMSVLGKSGPEKKKAAPKGRLPRLVQTTDLGVSRAYEGTCRESDLGEEPFAERPSNFRVRFVVVRALSYVVIILGHCDPGLLPLAKAGTADLQKRDLDRCLIVTWGRARNRQQDEVGFLLTCDRK
jgi:hypothetical protein